MKPASNSVGGANKSYPDAGAMGEKHGDDVGLNAGSPLPGGKNVAKGGDYGFQARSSNEFNPQGTKDGVTPESSGGVTYGGQTSFPEEP